MPDAPLTANTFGEAPGTSKAARIRASVSRRIAAPIALIILTLAVLLVYLPGIDIPYYGDDFGWVDTSTGALRHFVQVNADGWYRPVQASVFTLVQKHFGLNTIPIHLLTFLPHALLCWLILITVIRLGYPPTYALMAAVFMASSQANAFAVLSDDTLSQVAGSLFGCLSIWALLSWKSAGGAAARTTLYVAALAAFALALMSKETTASFFPILVGTILFTGYRAEDKLKAIKNVLVQSIPFAVVFLGYFLIRSLVGANAPSLGSGAYNFRIGLNVPVNLLLDFFGLAVPVSSVSTFQAFHTGNAMLSTIITAGSILFLAAIGYGLWLRGRDPKVAAVIIFLIGSTFPMTFMNHVSELYLYNSMPFLSVLVGIGTGALLDTAKRRYVKQTILASFILILASHVVAIREKALLMRDNGERAAALLHDIGPYINQVPVNGQLLLVNPATEQTEYAVYLMPGFKVLEFGESFIKKSYHREDISLRIIDEHDLDPTGIRPDSMILGLDGGTLKAIAKPTKVMQ